LNVSELNTKSNTRIHDSATKLSPLSTTLPRSPTTNTKPEITLLHYSASREHSIYAATNVANKHSVKVPNIIVVWSASRHHYMAHNRDADGGDGLRTFKIVAHALHKRAWTAEKRWSSSSRVGRGANNSPLYKKKQLMKCYTAPRKEIKSKLIRSMLATIRFWIFCLPAPL